MIDPATNPLRYDRHQTGTHAPLACPLRVCDHMSPAIGVPDMTGN